MDKAKLNLPLLLGFWALIAAVLLARALLSADRVPLIADTDDAMRLVVVRDLLAGQGWFDHLQYRLNTPFGGEIHWSRLVDLPIAALLVVLAPFGQSAATIAAYVWPLLLLLVLMALTARLTLRLVGPAGLLPALALPVLAPAVVAEFSPGRFDHHSVQILLTLLLVWSSIEALDRPRWAIGAGLLAATALAIGTEALPAVAAGVIVFGLVWAVRPERGGTLRRFGLSFALGTLAQLMLMWPPSRWLEPACDTISLVYGLAAAGTGLAFLLLPQLPPLRPALRLCALAGAGVLVAGTVIVLFPACLRGPYAALDPWLVENWLSRISEAKPLWSSLRDVPDLTVAIALPPLLGLGALAWRARRPDGVPWLVLGLYLAVAFVVMLVQVRGGRFADALAVPPAAAAIAWVRERYLGRRAVGWLAALVGSWIAFAGVAVLLLVTVATLPLSGGTGGLEAQAGKLAGRDACLQPGAFRALAALPPDRIMAPIDLGAHLLAFTPHAVVGAPYHRVQDGVRDTFDFFNGPITVARAILDRRGIGLVVICPSMSELRGLPDAAPDSFVRLYERGELPDWLVEQSLPDTPLRVFAVSRALAPPAPGA